MNLVSQFIYNQNQIALVYKKVFKRSVVKIYSVNSLKLHH